jgi:hypothetical protein
MVKGVADRALDQSTGVGGLQATLVLTLEFGVADKDRDQRGAAGHDVVGRQGGRTLVLADSVRMILETAQQGGAETRFMRAPVGRRDRVAIRMDEPVGAREPSDSPFDRTVFARLVHPPGENLVGYEFLTLGVGCEVVAKAAGKMERGLRRDFRAFADKRERAAPSNLDASEQIGFRARHLEHARRIKPRLGAENLGVGQKAHFGAAAVRRLADDGERGRGLAALKRLAIEGLTAGDLDFEPFGQRVHHRDADAMKSAGGLIGAAVELPARVEHRHDDFEGGFFGKFRVRIDRHPTAVVDYA